MNPIAAVRRYLASMTASAQTLEGITDGIANLTDVMNRHLMTLAALVEASVEEGKRADTKQFASIDRSRQMLEEIREGIANLTEVTNRSQVLKEVRDGIADLTNVSNRRLVGLAELMHSVVHEAALAREQIGPVMPNKKQTPEVVEFPPPPCITLERANEVYIPAFTRIAEYVANCEVEGDVLEFGTYQGYTASLLARLVKGKTFYLYDSWEGFPEISGIDKSCPEVAEFRTWDTGTCKLPEGYEVELSRKLNALAPCVLTKGYYSDTLPDALPEKACIVHIDCDLYESTYFVLSQLLKQKTLSHGAIIMFDDFNSSHSSDEYGERKALIDSGLKVEPWFNYGWSGYAFIYKG